MSVRLYIRDKIENEIHEYGRDPNDCLVLTENGDLAYSNIETGEFSGRDGNYEFVVKEEHEFPFIYDEGGNHERIDCWRCKHRKKRNVCNGCIRNLSFKIDRFERDEDAEKLWAEVNAESLERMILNEPINRNI